MLYCSSLQDLHRKCKWDVCFDDKSGAVTLKGSVTLKDEKGKNKTFSRKVDLTHLIVALKQRLAENGIDVDAVLDTTRDHRTIASGPLNITMTHTGGWLADTYHKVVSTAKKIGENQIARDIWEDVLPEVAPAIPYGQQALDLANKAHDVLIAARKGSKEAVGKIFMLKQQAQSGNETAHDVVKMMTTMNKLLKMKLEYQHDAQRDRVVDHVDGWLRNIPYRDPLTAATQESPGIVLRTLYFEGMH